MSKKPTKIPEEVKRVRTEEEQSRGYDHVVQCKPKIARPCIREPKVVVKKVKTPPPKRVCPPPYLPPCREKKATPKTGRPKANKDADDADDDWITRHHGDEFLEVPDEPEKEQETEPEAAMSAEDIVGNTTINETHPTGISNRRLRK